MQRKVELAVVYQARQLEGRCHREVGDTRSMIHADQIKEVGSIFQRRLRSWKRAIIFGLPNAR